MFLQNVPGILVSSQHLGNAMILFLLRVPATRPCYTSPQRALHTDYKRFLLLLYVRSNMSVQHDLSCLLTFIRLRLRCIQNASNQEHCKCLFNQTPSPFCIWRFTRLSKKNKTTRSTTKKEIKKERRKERNHAALKGL